MSSSSGYYLPNPSAWPIVGSIGLITMAIGATRLVNYLPNGLTILLCGAAIIVFMMFGWFGKVVGESERGTYNHEVGISFRTSMLWFIFSEVMFFAAFFGALFYARKLSVPWLADTELLWPGYDGGWPTAGPAGAAHIGQDVAVTELKTFSTISAWGIPLWNTIILLTSSVTVTIAHHALRAGHRGKLIFWMIVTVLLGAAFLYFQAEEYIHAYHALGLTLGSGVYGSTFFMLTGFHGFHVTIGTLFLLVILFRCIRGHFTADNHFAFEAAAWYWHFVDVVWAGLFLFVYVL